MRDVTEQLVDYFDATVERITADDVVAGRDITARPKSRDFKAANRPSWALGFAFATTILVIGVPLVTGLLLRAERAEMATPASPSYVIGESPALWGLLVGAGAMLGLVILTMAIRGAVMGNGGTVMTATMTRETVETDVQRLKTTNRILVITAIVLGVLAIGFGTWAIVQANTTAENALTEDIQTLINDHNAAYNNHDGAAFLAVVTESFRHDAGDGEIGPELQARRIDALEDEFRIEVVGDAIMIGDGPWTVSQTGRLVFSSETADGISVFNIVEQDGTLKIDYHNWIYNGSAWRPTDLTP